MARISTAASETPALGSSLSASVLTERKQQTLNQLSFSMDNYSVDEDAGTATITVNLETAATLAFTTTVQYATADGTATASSDYIAANGVLTFSLEATQQTFSVPILDDVLQEPDETVILTLRNPTNGTLQTPDAATLTILDNDYYIYMSLILKRWPPIPYTPLLNAIANADMDGDYVVDWESAELAETYTLEQTTNTNFTDGRTVYQGAGTSHTISDQPAGTYYYRVKATNGWGDSAWSNVRSTSVQPPSRITASADTTILQGYPTKNFGDISDMWAGYDEYLNPDGKIARSLIKFDVSGIPPGTPIVQAQVHVKLFGYYDYPNRSRTITTYRVGSNWSSGSVIWNAQPSIAEAYGARSVGENLGGWYAFDVTNLVRGWVNGSFANYGLWLRGPEKSGSDSSWRSFYTLNSPYDPYLSITYSGLNGITHQQNVEATDAATSAHRLVDKLGLPTPANTCQGQKCLNPLP